MTCTTQFARFRQATEEAYQLDEVISHAFIVLVDSMYNGVNQSLLVGLTQLCHIAKVHIGNAAIWHGENVAWMWVPMKQPKLQRRGTAILYVELLSDDPTASCSLTEQGYDDLLACQCPCSSV